MIKRTCTKDEYTLLSSITHRAMREFPGKFGFSDTMMDLEAVHCNGCPLDFQQLLDFPAGDFAHDMHGIAHHIDRSTGALSDGFDPRCAK